MIRILRFLWWAVGPNRRCIQVTWVLASQRLVRALVIVNLDELVETLLLLKEVERCGLGSLLLQG